MKQVIWAFFIILITFSCIKKKTNTRKTDEPKINLNNSGNNQDNTNCSNTISGCNDKEDSSGDENNNSGSDDNGNNTAPLVDPPDLPTIIGHGNVTPPGNPQGALWSSSTVSSLSSSYEQTLFSTDATFQIRVMAKTSPGQGTIDSYGDRCDKFQIPYSKLTINVRLRTKGSVSWERTHTFTDIPIGQKSEIKTFNGVPPTSKSMIVEITRAQWDYECTYQNRPHLCPRAPVTTPDCWEIGLEISTDKMKNLQ